MLLSRKDNRKKNGSSKGMWVCGAEPTIKQKIMNANCQSN